MDYLYLGVRRKLILFLFNLIFVFIKRYLLQSNKEEEATCFFSHLFLLEYFRRLNL